MNYAAIVLLGVTVTALLAGIALAGAAVARRVLPPSHPLQPKLQYDAVKRLGLAVLARAPVIGAILVVGFFSALTILYS